MTAASGGLRRFCTALMFIVIQSGKDGAVLCLLQRREREREREDSGNGTIDELAIKFFFAVRVETFALFQVVPM